VRDPHFTVWIKLASPLHGVEQKLTESQSDCISQVAGKVGFELHQERLDTLGSLRVHVISSSAQCGLPEMTSMGGEASCLRARSAARYMGFLGLLSPLACIDSRPNWEWALHLERRAEESCQNLQPLRLAL